MQKLDDICLTTKGFCKQKHLLSNMRLLVVLNDFGQEVVEYNLDQEKGRHHLDALEVCRILEFDWAIIHLALLQDHLINLSAYFMEGLCP